MRISITGITLAVVAVLAITGGITFAIASSSPRTNLTQPTWTLTRLVVAGQEHSTSATRPATLRFLANDHQISGTGGCNSYDGSYSLTGDQMRISGMRSTLVLCANANGVMDQEFSYLDALPRVTGYHIEGATLTLTGDNGLVSLTFRAS